MNQKELEAFAKEAALNAELDDHLGYAKHEKTDIPNNRNGFSAKKVKTEDGEFELNTPRVHIYFSVRKSEETMPPRLGEFI